MEHDWREPRGPLLRPLYTSLPLFTFDLAGEGMEREREGPLPGVKHSEISVAVLSLTELAYEAAKPGRFRLNLTT
ncbi:hypothetical protein C0Q70_16486 [Pomacea canaliculata]|uniref:Uncharacterized protein n=1 Tax=Pomacea canaliculata TaxID=400727 RepID=A0A2T7NPZ7_POMCA|nr:hypothetical protein C0Q70_16486 [Pomacea canaliculata]